MDKIKITREQQYKIQEWLNERSKRIAKENNVAKKSELHVQYTAVLKFIQDNQGEVVYCHKHSHKVRLNSLPTQLDLKNINPSEFCGLFTMLQYAQIIKEISLGGEAA